MSENIITELFRGVDHKENIIPTYELVEDIVARKLVWAPYKHLLGQQGEYFYEFPAELKDITRKKQGKENNKYLLDCNPAGIGMDITRSSYSKSDKQKLVFKVLLIATVLDWTDLQRSLKSTIKYCGGRKEDIVQVANEWKKYASEVAAMVSQAKATVSDEDAALAVVKEHAATNFMDIYYMSKNSFTGECDNTLTEATLNRQTAYNNMLAFDEGRRRENLKACKTEKLLYYLQTCLLYGLLTAAVEVNAELSKRVAADPALAPEVDRVRSEYRYAHHIKGLFPKYQKLTAKKETFTDELFDKVVEMKNTGKTSDMTRWTYEQIKYNSLAISEQIELYAAILLYGRLLKTGFIMDYAKTELTYYLGVEYCHPKKFTQDDVTNLLKSYTQNKDIIDIITKQINSVQAIIGKNKNISEGLIQENIEVHDELNPKLFEDGMLKEEVRQKVEEIVTDFTEDLAKDEIKIAIDDVILVGSNVSYNYTDKSDIDIHIITNTKGTNCPDNLYPKLYSAYRSLYNKKHDISFYGIPVEIYVETEDTKLASNGIYSVRNNKWIKEPTKEEIPEIDQEEFDAQFAEWEERYNEIVTNDSLEETISDREFTNAKKVGNKYQSSVPGQKDRAINTFNAAAYADDVEPTNRNEDIFWDFAAKHWSDIWHHIDGNHKNNKLDNICFIRGQDFATSTFGHLIFHIYAALEMAKEEGNTAMGSAADILAAALKEAGITYTVLKPKIVGTDTTNVVDGKIKKSKKQEYYKYTYDFRGFEQHMKNTGKWQDLRNARCTTQLIGVLAKVDDQDANVNKEAEAVAVVQSEGEN